MTGPIALQSRITYPRQARSGAKYLITVDLDHELSPEAWPYEDEEYPVTCFVDAAPHFVQRAAGEATIVVHRYGGSYGGAQFWLTAGAPGKARIRLVLVNGAGIPIASLTLDDVQIVERTTPTLVIPVDSALVTRAPLLMPAKSGAALEEIASTPEQWIQRFRVQRFGAQHSMHMLARAARLAELTSATAELTPRMVDPLLWEALHVAGLLITNAAGASAWRTGVAEILQRIAATELLSGVEVLSVNDQPQSANHELARLIELQARVRSVTSTGAALLVSRDARVDVVISDLRRGDREEAGFELIRKLRERSIEVPVIIYTGSAALGLEHRRRALRAGAFACTNLSEELFEWVLQATGRSVSRPLSAEERELLEILRFAGIEDPQRAVVEPELAGAAIAADDNALLALGLHRRVIEKVLDEFSDAAMVAVVYLTNTLLHVISPRPRLPSRLEHLRDRAGTVRRAIESGQPSWELYAGATLLPNTEIVARLVLPLQGSKRGGENAAVVIEVNRSAQLSEYLRGWLTRFCAPLGAVIRQAVPATLLSSLKQQIDESRVRRSLPDPAIAMGRRDRAIVLARNETRSDGSEAGAADFHDWIIDPSGGGVPITHAQRFLGNEATPVALARAIRGMLEDGRPVRRAYIYLAGNVFADGAILSLLTVDGLHQLPGDVMTRFGQMARRGEFREIVVLLEPGVLSPELPSTLQHLLPPSSPGTPWPAVFYAVGLPATAEQGLTSLFIRGLSGAAARADEGGITSVSLRDYLQEQRVRAHCWTHGEILLRPARAVVVAIAGPDHPGGTVRILDTAGFQRLEERQLNSAGVCRFHLPAGAYQAVHLETNVTKRFTVESAPSWVEVTLAPDEPFEFIP